LGDDDLHSLYAVADWFVHPTRYEGSSIVTLEAMAHGLPVLASRAGGLPDKVDDGVTGFLVPPGDAEALGERLRETSALDGRVLGAAGRALCESRFSWDVVAPQYVALYERLSREAADS
jgi:glycosyltransferase involved in cell wall biosynthesis